METFIVCPCQICNGRIEFDAGELGPEEGCVVQCPHCLMETALFVYGSAPTLPPILELSQPPVISHHKQPVWIVWAIAAAILIFIVICIAPFPADTDMTAPDLVTVSGFQWSRDEASDWNLAVTIKNASTNDIKDVEISCDYFAPSGTAVDSGSQTIYQIIKGGEERKFFVDMGYVNSQASSGNVMIDGFQLSQ